MVRRLVPLALVLALPVAARADVAPEAYLETCSLEAVSFEHRGCEACRASLREPEACAGGHANDGRQQVCRSGGATVWTEVWCLPDDAQVPPTTSTPGPSSEEPSSPPSAEAPPSGCSALVGRASSAPWACAALLALVASRRRLRASRRAPRARE